MAISSIGLWGAESGDDSAIGGGYSVGGNIVACDNNKGMQCGGTSNTPGGIVRSAINIWYGLTHYRTQLRQQPKWIAKREKKYRTNKERNLNEI